jgi:hypothetical protein
MRRLSRAAVALLVLTSGCGGAIGSDPVDSADSAESSTDGSYVLRVSRVTRHADPDGPRAEKVVVFANVEGLGPDDLLEDAIVLETARTPDGVEHAKERTRQSLHAGRRSLNVNFPVDRATERISELVIQVPIAHVTEFRPFDFEVVAGTSERTSCGPFWVRFEGEPALLRMHAGQTTREDLATFEARVPLKKLTYRAILDAYDLEITDASGNALKDGAWTGSGQQASGTYRAPEWRQDSPRDLVYPLHARFRVPEKFTLETARFRLVDVPIP